MKAAVKNLAPYFEGKCFFNNELKHISLNDYKNKYLLLFSIPSTSPLCVLPKLLLSPIKPKNSKRNLTVKSSDAQWILLIPTVNMSTYQETRED